MRPFRRLPALVAVVAAAFPGAAQAAEQTLVFHSTPVRLGSLEVARDAIRADSPGVDGLVTAMSADVVDMQGEVVPDQDVMLHHVVFGKVLVPDYTCSSFRDYDGNSVTFPVQRFYGEGEERSKLLLPTGYGYPNRATDVWGLVYMLMNHRRDEHTVRIRYTVRYAPAGSLVPVTPVWLDVRNCSSDPIFNVPGTGGRGSEYAQHADFRMPESGRLVAAGAHLHGGGLRLELASARCGTVFNSRPTWGGVEPLPYMHEPGPTQMTGFSDAAGIPVAAGESLRLKAVYDNSLPHVRVMGIALVYLARGPVGDCARFDPAPTEPSGRSPRIVLPLLKKPAGAFHRNLASTWVGDYRFGAERISLRRGATFTWQFVGREAHDVTLASGPVGFASPSAVRGSYRVRFGRPGTYKLFCSLHPTLMTQVISVRRR